MKDLEQENAKLEHLASELSLEKSEDGLHQTGSTWENGYCESFNSKLRAEFLNGEIFLLDKEIGAVASPLQYHPATLIARLSIIGPQRWGPNQLVAIH